MQESYNNKSRYKIALFCSVVLLAMILISDNSRGITKPYRANYGSFTARDFTAPLPDNVKLTPAPTTKPDWLIQYEQDKEEAKESVEGYTSVFMELEPLGKYYITAYSPQETGSWQTASGIKLHRADYENRYTEPTTCAVDPKLHKIGKNGVKFYIAEFDRVFIAQDTGRLIKGKHLDLAYTDLKSVKSFPTGNYQTYKVISLNSNYYTKEDALTGF